VIGDQLDAFMRNGNEIPAPIAGLFSGLLMLLQLCAPAQYGVDAAAAACTAFAALLADGHSASLGLSPEVSPADVELYASSVARVHRHTLIAALKHEGLAAKVARQRPDAVLVLAAEAYQDLDSSDENETQQQILRDHAELTTILAPFAVRVSPKTITPG
jgi:aconitase B